MPRGVLQRVSERATGQMEIIAMECRRAVANNAKLRLPPVKGVYVAGAGIAEHHHGAVGGGRVPGSILPDGDNAFQIHQAFYMQVAHTDPADGACSAIVFEVQVLAIVGKCRPPRTPLSYLGPLLGLKIKKQQPREVRVECRNMTRIGRPAWGKQSLRAWQCTQLMGRQIEDAEGSAGARGTG